MSALLFISIGYHFIDLSSSTIEKNRVTCYVRGCHERSIKNKRIRRHSFVPYLSGNVLTKFHGKSSNLHSLLIRWNDSRLFWSWRLLAASAAFEKQKSKQDIILSNSTFYNFSTDLQFVGVSACVGRLLNLFLEDTRKGLG